MNETIKLGSPAVRDEPAEFQVSLSGIPSTVVMNGKRLQGVRDVKIHQPLDGPLIVTIEFVAASVVGIDWKALVESEVSA